MQWMAERGGTSNYQGDDACFVRLRGLPFRTTEAEVEKFFKGKSGSKILLQFKPPLKKNFKLKEFGHVHCARPCFL